MKDIQNHDKISKESSEYFKDISNQALNAFWKVFLMNTLKYNKVVTLE